MPSSLFRFGDYELDIDRYELRRGSEVLKAEPRVLEMLNFLINQRERVVPKEELLDALWHGAFVSESALSSTIRDARRLLEDSSSDPRWIKTVYGRGFRFVGEVSIVVEDAITERLPILAPPAVAKARRSVAVLPFTDLSPEKDQGYFCDGIAEELINSLTRLEELQVVSRAAAFDFRKDEDLRVLGEQLGVDNVLRGSVRKAHDRLRITVHLVDTRTRHHVWSEKYDRRVGDIFALQEEIAENTARALLGVLSDRNRKAMKSTPVRIDAYEFYLKGRTYLTQMVRRSLEAAIGMFEVALEFDARYAPAYAGLADALAELYLYYQHDESLRLRAEEASERAVELAPQLAEAHICRGEVLALDGRFTDATSEFDLAMMLSPRSFDAYYRFGRVKWAEGDLGEATKLFETAWEIQPTDYQSPALLIQLYRTAGRAAEARTAGVRTVALCAQHLERRPDDARALALGAQALLAVDRPVEAEDWMSRALALEPEDVFTLYNAACYCAVIGDRQRAREFLNEAIRRGYAHERWLAHDHDLAGVL
ncbi:MAG TPA: winged helix-turn-helix domain-containing protein [Thermoanaerobaculia bacterium]|jgi:TolB-like protein/Tfp pilus assembly protein PilF